MPKKKNPYAEMYTIRPDGRYQGYYRDKDGKRHPVCDKDPEKLYHKLEQKISNQQRDITFTEIAEAWKDARWDKIEDGTQSCYLSAYKRALEAHGDVVAKDLMPRDISALLSELNAQGYAKRTIKAQRTIYSLIYKFAVNDERFEKQIAINPAAGAVLPDKMPKAKKREAPETDIVHEIQQQANTAHWGIFPLFLLCTGFRRGEALAVKWQDIDYKDKKVYCRSQISNRGNRACEKQHAKTEAGIRWVPLLAPLESALQKPAGAKQTDYVFFGVDPTAPMAASTYRKRWMHWCKDMGLVTTTEIPRISAQGHKYIYTKYAPQITAHNLRHAYVTMLFEAGVDVYSAQKFAGHSDITVTQAIYTHLRNNKLEASTKLLFEHTKYGL